jgi:hypothetical protein
MKETPSTADRRRSHAPRRFSDQQQQERRAIGQITEVFNGWSINPFVHDLGEDLVVQIYDDGRSTGLSFFLQLKSVRDIRVHDRKKSPDIIVYPDILVKDLLHWADSVPAVVVLVWDVTRRIGYWQDVPSITRCLDSVRPDWRTKSGKISIELPKTNRTDEVGRSALRTRVADIALPQLRHGKALELTSTFTFNDSPTDRELFICLERLIEDGGDITIPSRNIKEVRFSDWFERAYGRITPSEISIRPLRENPPSHIGFRVAGPDNTEEIHLAMTKTKAGTKSVTFATINDEQPLYAELILTSDRKSYFHVQLTFTPGQARDVHAALLLARFELALQAHPNITVLLPGGHELGPVQFSMDSFETEQASLKAWIDILQKLSFIQARVTQFGRFDLTSGVHSNDLADIEYLFAICSGAPIKTRMNLTAEIEHGTPEIEEGLADRSLNMAGMASLHLDQFDDAHCLNLRVPLGHCEVIFSDTAAFVKTFNQAIKSQHAEIHFIDTEATLHFRDWAPPHEGPKQASIIAGSSEHSA